MIEPYLLYFIATKTGLNVFAEEPQDSYQYTDYVVIEKTASRTVNTLQEATIAIQSYGRSLYDAMTNSAKVREAMATLSHEQEIGGVYIESEYNFTDPTTKRYRYQAVYRIYYYERLT